MKVKKEGNDLISRSTLMEEMSKISLDTEDDKVHLEKRRVSHEK